VHGKDSVQLVRARVAANLKGERSKTCLWWAPIEIPYISYAQPLQLITDHEDLVRRLPHSSRTKPYDCHRACRRKRPLPVVAGEPIAKRQDSTFCGRLKVS
jgi:hypothetical protein